MTPPTRDELETRVAHLAHETSSVRHNLVKTHDRLRSLEAAIKKHARGECGCKGHGECLTRLVTLTPANPRQRLPGPRRIGR